jgi:hypothetical protein
VEVEQPTGCTLESLELTEEEAQEDPLYAAIVRHVVRKVRQSQQEG